MAFETQCLYRFVSVNYLRVQCCQQQNDVVATGIKMMQWDFFPREQGMTYTNLNAKLSKHSWRCTRGMQTNIYWSLAMGIVAVNFIRVRDGELHWSVCVFPEASQGGVNMPAIQEPVKEASIDSEHMGRVYEYMHIQSKAVPIRHAGAKRSIAPTYPWPWH
jgi:hypothetical protein